MPALYPTDGNASVFAIDGLPGYDGPCRRHGPDAGWVGAVKGGEHVAKGKSMQKEKKKPKQKKK